MYYVSNEGSGNNRKAVMRKENSSGEIVNGDLGFVLKNTTAGNVQILFPDLISNSGYSVEISYETYRNNVSIIDDENAKKIVDPYTDSIYTPVSAGIIFGNINATKVSDTSFKLDYVGGNYLESVKCISFTSRLLGTNTAISGTLSDNSLFTKSGSNYSLLIGNSSSNNFNLNFATKGTYNITMTYYTNLSCSNDSKVNSHTSVIVVE